MFLATVVAIGASQKSAVTRKINICLFLCFFAPPPPKKKVFFLGGAVKKKTAPHKKIIKICRFYTTRQLLLGHLSKLTLVKKSGII